MKKTHHCITVVLGLTMLGLSLTGLAGIAANDNPVAAAYAGLAQPAATPTGFMYAPYYGTTALNAVFDHFYPMQSREPEEAKGSIVHHDGTTQNWAYSGHAGVDYDVNFERVLAAADGEIHYAGWRDPRNHRLGYGLFVRIAHNNDYQTIYGHLSSLAVQTGDEVWGNADQHTVIGVGGNTGGSDGAHLHFEVRNSSNLVVNPYGWVGMPGEDPWEQREVRAISHNLWASVPALHSTERYPTGPEITPVPEQPNPDDHYRIDDAEAGFEPAGTCHERAGNGYGVGYHYGSAILSDTIAATCTVRWRLAQGAQAAGYYDVYAYIPAAGNLTGWALYRVHHDNDEAEAEVVLAQNDAEIVTSGYRWAYMGQYYFEWTGTEYIEANNLTTDTAVEGIIVAYDALMFVPAWEAAQQPTRTPTVTPSPQPPREVLVLPLDGTLADSQGHEREISNALNAPMPVSEANPARAYYRFDPTDGTPDGAIYRSVAGSGLGEDLYQGHTAHNGFTVGVWFRADSGSGGSERTVVNMLYDNPPLGGGTPPTPKLKGWNLSYNAASRVARLTVYDKNSQASTVAVVIPSQPQGPQSTGDAPWVYVRAIKDGLNDRLYLCAYEAGWASVSAQTPFNRGVDYYVLGDTVRTRLRLGAMRHWPSTDGYNAAESWYGDIDEVRYVNYADYGAGCEDIPTPTPTATRTPTATPTASPTRTPAPWLPPETVIDMPMEQASLGSYVVLRMWRGCLKMGKLITPSR